MSKYSLKILIFLFLISIFTYGIKRPAHGFELTNDFTAKYIHNTKNESSILYSEDSYVANAAYLFLNPKLEIADDTIRMFFDSEINYINPKWNQEQNTKKESSQYKINELYGQVYLSDFVLLRAGKQVLKWGTGYFYNPIDFFVEPIGG